VYCRLSVSLSPFPVAPILEHRASVKHFVSHKFLLRQLVGLVKPLPTQDNTIIRNTDIHILSGIRTHDPSIRANEDSSYARPRDHCVRRIAD
jgi:hypothetical protein